MDAVAPSFADVLDEAARNVPETDAAWDELLVRIGDAASQEKKRKDAEGQSSTDAADPTLLDMFIQAQEVLSREEWLALIVEEVTTRRERRLKEQEEQEHAASLWTEEGPGAWEEGLEEREEQEAVQIKGTLEEKEQRAHAYLAMNAELLKKQHRYWEADITLPKLEAVRAVVPRTRAEEVAQDRVLEILRTEAERGRNRKIGVHEEQRMLDDLQVLRAYVPQTQADRVTWLEAFQKYRTEQRKNFVSAKDFKKNMIHSQQWIDWHKLLQGFGDNEIVDIETNAVAHYLDHGFTGSVFKDNYERASSHADLEYTGHYDTQAADRYVLWTDASVNKWGAAGAAVAYKNNMALIPTPWVTKAITLERGMRSTDAEAWAIMEALNVAKTLIYATKRYKTTGNVGPKVVVIYSDCATALNLIKEWPFGPVVPIWPIVKNIATYTYAIEQAGYKVELRWIPGHKGLLGNELADMVANEVKEASRRAHMVIGPHP